MTKSNFIIKERVYFIQHFKHEMVILNEQADQTFVSVVFDDCHPALNKLAPFSKS